MLESMEESSSMFRNDDGDHDDNDEDSSDLSSFHNKFQSMSWDRMWVLKSGRSVESVVFDKCRSMSPTMLSKSTARAYLIDLSDQTTKSWFTSEEWQEIEGALIPLPSLNVSVAQYLERFSHVRAIPCDTSERAAPLRSAVNESTVGRARRYSHWLYSQTARA